VHVLAKQTLPKLNSDKSGVLEVTVRDCRNVTLEPEAGNKFHVALVPGGVVVGEGADQVALEVRRIRFYPRI
jgi:hypothetical protein